jgi:hypothetical protein
MRMPARLPGRIWNGLVVAAMIVLVLSCRGYAGAKAVASGEAESGKAEAKVETRVEARPGLEQLRQLSLETQPRVAQMIGLPSGDPVAVDLMTHAELAEYMKRVIDLEYPDHDLQKRGRCLWEIGLVPRGYDLEEGMMKLIAEQAGAIYDPHTKCLKGLSYLPPQMSDAATQKLIVSHELCHALQDRVIDILAQSEICLTDLDREYAVRATIEGMATVLMLAYSQGLSIDQIPDARATMRAGFAYNENNPGMRVMASSPAYLKESLLSPYADGAAFTQAWQAANPGAKVGAMLDRMPVTSEQALHFEKYAEQDQPVAIDLSAVGRAFPEGWSLYYANTLGEFDLRMLFETYEETRAGAAAAAQGWDGLKFEAYTDAGDDLVLIASSAWDSEADAAEFADSFARAVGGSAGADRVSLVREGATVSFAIGADKGIRDKALGAIAAPGR